VQRMLYDLMCEGYAQELGATIKFFARASKKAQDVEIKPSRDRRAQQRVPTAENRTRGSSVGSGSSGSKRNRR
jgi:hypothetical protein